MPDFEERTQEATPRKRQRAKEKGQVARSRELVSMAASGAILLGFFVSGEKLMAGVSDLLRGGLSLQYGTEPLEVIRKTGSELFLYIMPLLIVSFSMVLLSGFMQGGFVLKSVEIDMERINPLGGFKRLFSMTGIFEFLKGLAKFLIGGFVIYLVLRKYLPEISRMPAMYFEDIERSSLMIIKKSTLTIFITFLSLSFIDYIYERFRFERSLRMTRQELKEEFRETEGDPLIKARIRSIQRELARKRMLQEVPKATVVVTNPTHIAVALLYKKEMAAPKVIAKGADFLAEKIKEIARTHGVPIYEDRAIARALFKVKLDSYIPEELYRAVARIIAYVYRLRGVS
ncbi:MAG: EscU/YscU/HrcU family type III secretion system export apparatus switch protein [Thermodesulfovibrionales bacterium]|nr:EscU/YscU/HrcU family type III secretion system export apparatus switch protein [Thermodesulfovibrionales bacterium]